MRNSVSLSILLILSIFSISCASQKKQAKTPATVGDNSMTSLDWNGIYRGILPCADCPGIKIQLLLNSDMTYKVKTSYLERGTEYESEGSFSWNETGNIIALDSNFNQKYLVGENLLIQLDGEGNRITGDLAPRYILEKEHIELTGKNWKLIMLNEKPVKSEAKQPFMILTNEESKVNGNTGCNNFFGTYKLTAANEIRFSQLGMTKMACIGDNPEREYIEALDKTTYYSLTINELILKDDSGNNLAKFEEDYFLE